MNKRNIIVLLAVFVCIVSLVSCKDDEVIDDSYIDSVIGTQATTTEETTTEQTTLQTESNFNEFIDPLTGEISSSSLINSRPIAVMINNHKDSLPQYGIADADIMFEIPVEGGITRMMAIYQNYETVKRVCSVRSSRYYFAELSQGFDAVYLHWGLDMSLAKATLENNNIDHFDGGIVGAPIFGRDPERLKTYSKEHTAYLEGENLKSVLDQYHTRTDIKDELKNKTYFNFYSDDEPFISDKQAQSVRLNFSKSYFSDLKYDETTKKYLKFHSGSAQIDSNTREQLAYTNVLVLNTSITQPYVNTQLLNVDLSGGTGLYFSEGKLTPISWTKGDVNSPIKLYNVDASELKINKGNTYIGIIGYDKVVSVE